jgi:hypothetical protein
VPAKKGRDYNCTWVAGGSKEEYARIWRPYQKEILEAATLAGFDADDRDTDYVSMFDF